MRVLILWADQRSPNLGVQALAASATRIALETWPDAEIDLQDFAPNATGFALGKRAMLGQVWSRDISHWIDQYDVVLDTGAGDSFSDIYGLKRLFMMWFTQRARVSSGKPLVLLPQTVGPFRSRMSRILARSILSQATAVHVRDPESQVEAIRLGARSVQLATDLVFALPGERRLPRHDILYNISGLLWNPNPHVDHDRYREAVRLTIKEFLAAGRRVAILPHVVGDNPEDNDLFATYEVQREFPNLQVIVPTDLATARAEIAASNLLVGARMHACLNALSQGVPAIAWAYSRKFAPLMKSLDWSLVIGFDTATTARSVAELTLEYAQIQNLDELAKQVSAHGQDQISNLKLGLARAL